MLHLFIWRLHCCRWLSLDRQQAGCPLPQGQEPLLRSAATEETTSHSATSSPSFPVRLQPLTVILGILGSGVSASDLDCEITLQPLFIQMRSRIFSSSSLLICIFYSLAGYIWDQIRLNVLFFTNPGHVVGAVLPGGAH